MSGTSLAANAPACLTGFVEHLLASSPSDQLLFLTNGKRIAQVVYVLAKLGVADHLVDGPQTVRELATATESDSAALYQVLRCAAAVGVFAEQPDGRFALTPMAQALRSDLPGSLRDLVLLNGDQITWRPYGDIAYSVRTGQCAFDQAFGMGLFEYLEAHPDTETLFDRSMTQLSQLTTNRLLAQFDFGSFRCIADVGGGHGSFLAEVLRRNPATSGLLFDRPAVIAEAERLLTELGVADRVTLASGDFFEGIPAGYDAYLLKTVLLDWSDAEAEAILCRIREAIGDRTDSRLLVLERVLAAANAFDVGKLVDIDMLVLLGGRQRGLEEHRQLVEAAGFELVSNPTPGQWAVLECRPC